MTPRSFPRTLAFASLAISLALALAAAPVSAHHRPTHTKGGGGTTPPPPPAYECWLNDQARGPGTVVFTFDDTLRGQYAAGGVLGQRGMCATFFAVSGMLRDGSYFTDYMSATELKDLSARGHDVESHTVTHPDLTTLSSSNLQYQLSASQQTLQQLTGKSVRHFAYPFAAYNPTVQSATDAYYATARSYTDSLDEWAAMPRAAMALPALGIEAATSLATAKTYVDYAKNNGATLILVFHDLRDSPRTYDWRLSDLAALADYAAQSGVNVRTIAQAADQGLVPTS